jgi:hypothetical protein
LRLKVGSHGVCPWQIVRAIKHRDELHESGQHFGIVW